jgi:TatD DNase family protein
LIGKIVAVCISEKKGTAKINVGQAEMVENHGLKGDAHAGNWHRQVSLLSFEKIEAFKKKGVLVKDGAFGENLIVEGIDLKELPIGTKLMVNNIELEVTQIGKECHSHCAIYEAVGDCIMPREGIFARVLKGGRIKSGDEIKVVYTDEKN